MVVSYLVDASFSSYRDCIKVQTVFQKLLNEIKIFFAGSLNDNNSREKE
jgi:hypothetical protein